MLSLYGLYARRKGWITPESDPNHYILKLSEFKRRVYWLSTEWDYSVSKKFSVNLDCCNMDPDPLSYSSLNVQMLSQAFLITKSLKLLNMSIASVARWNLISPIIQSLAKNRSLETIELLIIRIPAWEKQNAFAELGTILRENTNLTNLSIRLSSEFATQESLVDAVKAFFKDTNRLDVKCKLCVRVQGVNNQSGLFIEVDNTGNVHISDVGFGKESVTFYMSHQSVLILKDKIRESIPGADKSQEQLETLTLRFRGNRLF